MIPRSQGDQGVISSPPNHPLKKEIADYMATIGIAEIMKTLRTGRVHTRKELKKLDKVISALGQLSSTNSVPGRNGRRHRMSAAARRKIGAAQRKRWAKFHQQQANKG
jgi:hypothetical protein